MSRVQQPKLTTKADIPRLGDRVGDVLKNDFQHRSGWEVTVHMTGLLLLMTASSFIWRSASSIEQKVIESIVALAVIAAVSTAILVKIRFRG